MSIITDKFDSVFTCPRCDGTGKIEAFSHINNGICFLCCGAKKINVKTKYPKGKIYAEYSAEYNCYYPEIRNKNKIYMQYNECISIAFDNSGRRYGYPITDSNRDEMRLMWKWLKSIDAELVVNKKEKDKGDKYSY